MITKVLIRITVVIFIFTINICSAYRHDEVPELLNTDLRLAATGNLDIVVVGWDNEINAYDFGESPAGVIEDNNGKSTVYAPGIYGFTQFDSLPNHEWSGYALSALGIVKIKSQFATGFTYSRNGADYTHKYGVDLQDSENYDSHLASLITAYRILSGFTLGFSGSYSKKTTKWQYYTYIEEDYHDIYSYKPAILIQPAKLHWQFGFNYKLSKHKTDPSIHDFTIPIIFSSPQLRLGIKGGLGTTPYDGPARKSLKLRSIYRILAGFNAVNLGVLFAYANPLMYEDFSFFWVDGWETDYGIGIAYEHEIFGMIGLQYKRNIKKEYWDWEGYEYSTTIHKHYISCGAEILLLSNIPVRIGYVDEIYDHQYSYYNNPAYDLITAGFGIRIPKAKLEIDFAYNVKFIDRAGGYWHDYVDKDHIFGLSGRFIF